MIGDNDVMRIRKKWTREKIREAEAKEATREKIRGLIDKYGIVVDAGKVYVYCETTPKQQDEIMAAVPDIVECWEYDEKLMDAKLDAIFESLTRQWAGLCPNTYIAILPVMWYSLNILIYEAFPGSTMW